MKQYLWKLTVLVLIVSLLLPMTGGITAAPSQTASRSESLPRIDLYTDSQEPVTTKTYEGASLSMTLPDRYATYTNRYTTKDGGRIQIRCRGNSTYETNPNRLGDSGKYSYKIKLEEKADFLGMGASRHWVLIANFYDVTNLRNKLAYDLSGAMGLTYTQSRWVVVYLNGAYQGLYTLCESIRIDEERVDITDWDERAKMLAKRIAEAEGLNKAAVEVMESELKNDLSWVTKGTYRGYNIYNYCDRSELNYDSGYLLEYDMRQDGDTSKFTTPQGIKIQLDSPTALDTNPEMYEYVTGLISQMEEALWSDTFCTADGIHYSKLVDTDSLVDYFIIFNLFKNIEFGWLSIFLYIEDGKIYFGPCWDFDGGSGNQVTLYEDWMRPDQWFYMGGRAAWWKELCGDPYFVSLVKERWQEIRPLVELYMESLPVWKEYIQTEANRNFKHFGAPKNWYIGGKCESFESEYEILAEWMTARIQWLDAQWSLRDPNMEGVGHESSDRLHMKLQYADKTPLSEDILTAVGSPADCLYDLSQTKDLTLQISTEHTSHQKVYVYVNGKLISEKPLTMDTPAKVTIRRGTLDQTPGAVNVIYIVGHNGTQYYRASYMTLRMAEAVPTEQQFAVRVGNQYFLTDQEGKITLPEITVQAKGFYAVGWTDGSANYPAGSALMVNRSTYLWLNWEREDPLIEFVEKEYVPSSAVTPTPTIPVENRNQNHSLILWITVGILSVTAVIAIGCVGVVWYYKKKKSS